MKLLQVLLLRRLAILAMNLTSNKQVQINLAGTIGDKLTLGADWNTERQFQYENQLKLKYTGFEDEIIQSIEAGNVSLQTSPLIGGSEALFGVKALFKMGPFSLTALASQKKSEIKEVSVSGGAKSQKFEIHAYDYSPNHFFIHERYTDPVLFNNYFGNPVPKVDNTLRERYSSLENNNRSFSHRMKEKEMHGSNCPVEQKGKFIIINFAIALSNRSRELEKLIEGLFCFNRVLITNYMKLPVS